MQKRRRAALYARFSTDLQNDKSVDDQLELCRKFAESQGAEVVAEYYDRARSGATMFGRDGLSRLLQDARHCDFDVVITEALDRLSRDQEDLAHIHKRLTFGGIEIVAVHDGTADAIQVGIRGLVSSLFLSDLKHKTRRGMSAVVKDGRHPGGRAFGYRPVKGEPGILEIYEPEAEVVRRIFAEYLDGKTPREIAGGLNEDGIPAPRGSRWNASTINGNKARGYGIIQNPIYGGKIVWNRVHMVRDPDTGKRISRPNPPEEWETAEAPELAIISPEDFEAAQAQKMAASYDRKKSVKRNRKSILSGLLKCAKCGGGMTMHDRRGSAVRIRCSTSKESGSCSNGKRYRLDKIEKSIVSGMRDRLEDADAIAAFLDEWQADRRNEQKRRARIEKRLKAAKGKLDRLSMLLLEEKIEDEFFDRQAAVARQEIADAERELAEAPDEKIVSLHPGSVRAYRKAMKQILRTIEVIDPREDANLFEAFRSLIDHVVIHDAPDGAVECEVIGVLGPLTDGADSWGCRAEKTVAGGRFAQNGLYTPTTDAEIPYMEWGRFIA